MINELNIPKYSITADWPDKKKCHATFIQLPHLLYRHSIFSPINVCRFLIIGLLISRSAVKVILKFAP